MAALVAYQHSMHREIEGPRPDDDRGPTTHSVTPGSLRIRHSRTMCLPDITLWLALGSRALVLPEPLEPSLGQGRVSELIGSSGARGNAQRPGVMPSFASVNPSGMAQHVGMNRDPRASPPGQHARPFARSPGRTAEPRAQTRTQTPPPGPRVDAAAPAAPGRSADACSGSRP